MNANSKVARLLGWVIAMLLVVSQGACVSSQVVKTPLIGAIPTTFAPRSAKTETPNVLTPAPGQVEVVLVNASDSLSGVFFTIRNAAGEVIFEISLPIAGQTIIYLPPGEYTWVANAPVPTAPPGCFNVLENYGFNQDGRFTAIADRIVIEVKLGMIVETCTPTPAPSVSQIAFVSDRDGNKEIYRVDQDGNHLVRVTNDPADDNYPTWSPDGEMIAFVSDRTGEDQVYVMGKNGSEVKQLTNMPGMKYQLLWSPDGKYIASIIRDDEGQNYQYNLNLISPDGSKSIGLLDLPPNIAPASYSWSPDGRQIAFDLHVSYPGQDAPAGSCSPYIVNLDGSGFSLLSPKNDTGDILACQTESKEVSWSSDGEWIAYVSTYYEDIFPGEGLFKIRPDGSGMINLTPFPILGRNNNPTATDISWSPSGQKLAFSSNLNDNGIGFYTINSDGTGITQVSNADGQYYIRWSPDEKYLAYLGWNNDHKFDVYIVNADGNDSKNITDSPADDYAFSWSPVGSTLNKEKTFDESQVRYVLADIQLGGVDGYYRQYMDQPAIAEAIYRWDAGVRVVNINDFERKIVGTWKIVYAGTNEQIDGRDVQLTTDQMITPASPVLQNENRACIIGGITDPIVATDFNQGWPQEFDQLNGRYDSLNGGQVVFTYPGIQFKSGQESAAYMTFQPFWGIFAVRLKNTSVYQIALLDGYAWPLNYKDWGSWAETIKNGYFYMGLHVDNFADPNSRIFYQNSRDATVNLWEDPWNIMDGEEYTVVFDLVNNQLDIFDANGEKVITRKLPPEWDGVPEGKISMGNFPWWVVGDPWTDNIDSTDLRVEEICFGERTN